jgi:hypothetical protein
MLFIICEYANQRKVLILRIFSIGLCVWADYLYSIVRLACDLSKKGDPGEEPAREDGFTHVQTSFWAPAGGRGVKPHPTGAESNQNE